MVYEMNGERFGANINEYLRKPLLAELVSETVDSEDGYVKSHLTGHVVISQLNRIFGPGGYSWVVDQVPTLVRTGGHYHPQTQERVDSHESYMCVGRLIVKTPDGDVEFSGVGVESVDLVSSGGMDRAIKGAETDAMKRAARHLGAQFGLSLYFRGALDIPKVLVTGESDAVAPPQQNGTPPAPSASRVAIRPLPLLESMSPGEKAQLLYEVVQWADSRQTHESIDDNVKRRHNGRGPTQLSVEEMDALIQRMHQRAQSPD